MKLGESLEKLAAPPTEQSRLRHQLALCSYMGLLGIIERNLAREAESFPAGKPEREHLRSLSMGFMNSIVDHSLQMGGTIEPPVNHLFAISLPEDQHPIQKKKTVDKIFRYPFSGVGVRRSVQVWGQSNDVLFNGKFLAIDISANASDGGVYAMHPSGDIRCKLNDSPETLREATVDLVQVVPTQSQRF